MAGAPARASVPPRPRWADFRDSDDDDAASTGVGRLTPPADPEAEEASPVFAEGVETPEGKAAAAASAAASVEGESGSTGPDSRGTSKGSVAADPATRRFPRPRSASASSAEPLPPAARRRHGPRGSVCEGADCRDHTDSGADRVREASPSPAETPAARSATLRTPSSVRAVRGRSEPSEEASEQPAPPRGKRPRGEDRGCAKTVLHGLNRPRSEKRAAEASPSRKDLQRRVEKRLAALELVKATPEYKEMVAGRQTNKRCKSTDPRTPDPEDSTVSKRKWEADVALWRHGVRKWSTAKGDERGAASPVRPLSSVEKP
eukprot:TRINITY_DN3653_c0_g2_i1.p1 TRINITY_DN3653_c0_g2~~TRINITY_DN3653_c0_g2_i1.p1  ORF type:complete len:344 (+),score=40.03 TRINITY_DN3653_c0_g2_i1:80-1033(+)